MGNKHWQSFSELNNTESFEESEKNEFSEDLPFYSDNLGVLESKSPRRDFLKYLGFSTAAAAIAASCEIPIKKSIPFANKPEEIIPGTANYYATTYVQDGDAISILAKVRDGRPIKIEGNELSPITKGGTSARVQASVLDLYDTARLRYPFITKKQNEVTFEAIDKSVTNELAGLGGAQVVLLTSTINSPTSLQVISQFLQKYPGSRHVQYDAVSYSGMLLANEASYGKTAIPSYHFDRAKVIVSIGADFLGTWLSPVEFAKQYSAGRKIDEKNPEMSKHIQFESVLTLTGSNADERYLHLPSQTAAVTSALLSAVNGTAITGINDPKLKAGIAKTAQELAANRGAALVVSGSNDSSVQAIVNAINEAIGANGKTIDWSSTLNCRKGIDSDFQQLVDDMNAGKIGGLLIHSANPVYTWFDSKKVADGIKKVKVTVSFAPKYDETTQLCKYVIPDHHFLESWGDAEPKSGFISLIQPTIYPLFKTRQWQDSLLKWSNAPADYLAFVKQYWMGNLGGEHAWDKALQDGLISHGGVANNTAAINATSKNSDSTGLSGKSATGNNVFLGAMANGSGTAAYISSSANNAVSATANAPKGGQYELVLYQKVAIGAGHGTSNPWLQEMPDPVTRVTWDNYAILSPDLAKTILGIDISKSGDADDFEVHPEKPVVKISVGGKEAVELPVIIIPGTQPNTIGIAVGYGRSAELGKAVVNSGKNVFHLASFSNNTVSFHVPDVKIEKTGDTYKLALSQTHNIYDTAQGVRTEVVKELTLPEFKKNPTVVVDERLEEIGEFGGIDGYAKQGTLFPYHEKPGIHWGMSVDMNSCIGCGACVVACQSENNVSVVGKDEVARFHDMAWLRIDRYYSGNMENPNVVFQPMLCQHCDNAPCENVCPVDATNHSSEGLNQMAYNRCIGTKYCANNCPYKVRRFNWFDYNGADSFPDNQKGIVGDVVMEMNDSLSRMVLNPDVTVRSRGVMEKCSFCVQRLQEGKLTAKRQSRPLKTGENNEWDLKTACQQACPTDSFVFGNVNDSQSAISQMRRNNPNRTFYVIEMLHTLPNVNYFVKLRNKEEDLGIGNAELSKV